MHDHPPVTPRERLYRIVEDGMCIGCGLCQTVAGSERVRMSEVPDGNLRPLVAGELDHETVDRIVDVCPGTRVEGLPPEQFDDETRIDTVWGPYRHMVQAWAADPDVRYRAATGGVLTALARFLVGSGRVRFVLHVEGSRRMPGSGEPRLSFDRADVLAGAASVYGPAAPLADIASVLEREEPFAFVGKPCDIAALRNLARFDPRVDRLVRYWLTPVCGGYLPPAASADILRDNGIDPARVTYVRYRGFGCPGPTRIELDDGSARELGYTDFWPDDESKWSLPFRCKVCPDGIGEAADLAAADDWPGGAPDPATMEDDRGTNAVIARTAAGADLLDAAVREGWIRLGDVLDPRHMDATQPHQVKKKLAARARFDGLLAEGATVPRTARLRLDALARRHGAEANELETQGTRRRVREGRNAEPKPTAARRKPGEPGIP